MFRARRHATAIALISLTALLTSCAYSAHDSSNDRVTKRDKTKKGAAIGAASGAVLGAVIGEGELDEILAGAAIGAGVGAGVGTYMDRQEERLAHIPGTTVERVSEDILILHFASDVLFEVNSSMLDGQALSNIEQAAEVFNEFHKTAIITQGHTDSTGSEAYNLQLSERRAETVRNHLVSRGVEPERISSLGYGEGSPVARNDTEEGRLQNRRVDLLLKVKAR